MNPHGKYLEAPPAEPDTRLAWLVALVAGGLVIVAGALALDLHNQSRRAEELSVLLRQNQEMREAGSKSLAARYAVTESALKRLDALYNESQADLKKLRETYSQREPMAKQANEMQDKLQAVANDLLELAKTDEDARAIVRKYNIQQSSPAPKPGAAKP